MKKLKLFLLSIIIGFGVVVHADTKMPNIVSVAWLKAHYSDKNLVIVDVRKEDVFKKQHLKHAVNMPTFKDLFDTSNQYKLPSLDKLKEEFSKAGIDDNSEVLVYGNNELIWAARLYWISQVLGHDDVGLLAVGFGNWKKGTLLTSTKIYHPKRTDFIPRVDNTKLETKLSTYMAIDKDVIIDGRPAEFYKGLKSHAKRYGHIPSALNYPGSQNYNLNGSGMKNIKKLEKIYAKLPKDKKIILYCEDGADAALNYLILQKLGYKASVYDGSWLEWGNDSHLPMEH